jgi:hypothetical protein
MSESKSKLRSRDVGAGVMLVVVALVLGLWAGEKAGWWEERYLVLAAVKDPQKLTISSPVFFRGVEIGEVSEIKPPEKGRPGFKLRLEVEKTAWRHIPLDAPVRVDAGRPGYPSQVTILPGTEEPDWNFPGQVKVLREVTPDEDLVRLVRDVLDGLSEVIKAKAQETQLQDLKEKVKQLQSKLDALTKANPPLSPAPASPQNGRTVEKVK